jgi:branched-subunit amino acid ABC-type transport system permease component
MDPPNVLWFAGAYSTALCSYALFQTLPNTHKSVWILLAAMAFLLAYGAAARLLLRALWRVPAGHAAALNRWTSALALLAIGLSIFVLGMLLRRYGEAWGERFVRRPPPNIAASP